MDWNAGSKKAPEGASLRRRVTSELLTQQPLYLPCPVIKDDAADHGLGVWTLYLLPGVREFVAVRDALAAAPITHRQTPRT